MICVLLIILEDPKCDSFLPSTSWTDLTNFLIFFMVLLLASKSFVPAWMTNASGFRLTFGLIRSIIPSNALPEKKLTLNLFLFFDKM